MQNESELLAYAHCSVFLRGRGHAGRLILETVVSSNNDKPEPVRKKRNGQWSFENVEVIVH